MSLGHLMPESKEVFKKYKQVTRTKKPAYKGMNRQIWYNWTTKIIKDINEL